MDFYYKKVKDICIKSKYASYKLSKTSNSERNLALTLISKSVIKNMNRILIANKKDVQLAKKRKLASNLVDRLFLDENRILNLSKEIQNISKLKDPLGKKLSETIRPNGLKITKVSVPLGVIAVVFESRPNVTSDVASLCIKSGNSVILKGGKESKNSTETIISLIQKELSKTNISPLSVTSLKDYSRESVTQLFKMDKYVDVLIPRGGKGLIKQVRDKSNIPVFSHLDGICHTYIDKFASKEMALKVALNAKMRRTSICGATETILCHSEIADAILPELIEKLSKSGCKIIGDIKVIKYSTRILKAKESDWSTEYLDSIVSIKIVKDIFEAIDHINHYGSMHTDAIITKKKKMADIFFKNIESAIVMHNTSTQFADGAEFGLGAEVGISTGKLHARGPVSLEGLTTYKYLVSGKGQIRN